MNTHGVARRSRLFPDRRKNAWQQGIIEVRFSPDVKPQITRTPVKGGVPALQSLGGIDLSKFHQLAAKWHVQKIHSMVDFNASERGTPTHAGKPSFSQLLGDFVHLRFDRNAPVELIAREFAALPGVDSASPLPVFSGCALPNDTYLGTNDQIQPQGSNLENQWYIFKCRANEAWELLDSGGARINGHGVNLAIVDESFDANHEDLRGRFTQSFNVVSNNASLTPLADNIRDHAIHGTAVAGIAGATGNNNQGICGFAWGANLWLVQTQAPSDQTPPANPVFAALQWVGKNPAITSARTVVNISMGQINPTLTAQGPIDAKIVGSGPPNTTIQQTIDALIDTTDRAVVCIAAGNDEKGQSGRDVSTDSDGNPDPNGGSKAIVVGAMFVEGNDNVRYPSSNWGSRVTVCAPGDLKHDMTCSAGIDGPYRSQFGQTSGATPKVAGTAAMMLQANPNLTHDMVKAILNGTGTELTQSRFQYAKPIGPMLNTLEAVKAAIPSTTGPKLISNRFLNFGSVDQGSNATLNVSVFNLGSKALQLTSLQAAPGSSDRFSLATPFTAQSIPAGGTVKAEIPIQFAPTSKNDVRATFNLTTNDPTTPTIPITCTGTAPWKLPLWGKALIGAGVAVVIYIVLRSAGVVD